MDDLEKVETENVNLHSSVRTLCKYTDDIVSSTKKEYGKASRLNIDNIEKVENLNIFMTGFTGDVGGYMARSLLKRNNTIYCIVRSSINPKLSAKERFEKQCKKLLIYNDYYKNNKIHFIAGDYFKPYLGINNNDWNLLINKIDVIFSVGCRVVLTMSWSKAVNGILRVTNYLIELSLINKIKPLFVIASSGSRIALFTKPGYGMNRGYALAKYTDLQRLIYFHYTTQHPMKLLFLGYLDRHENGPPNFNHVLHSLFFAAFKLNAFPDYNAWFDYANAQEICEKSLSIISFKSNKLIYGGYAEKKNYLYFPNTFKLLKRIQPSMKLVSIQEWDKIIRKIQLNQGHRKLNSVDDIEKECNLLYFEPPSNNINGITAPSEEMFMKILIYIKNVSLKQFMNKEAESSKYFNYPWWDNIKINNQKSKL